MIKLSIEMVPSTSWYNNVRSMVTKKEWDIIRKKVYAKADYKCEICGKKGKAHPVECHETWEYDDENHIQKLTGMIALCPSCHLVKHMGRAKIVGKYDDARKHLSKTNKWTASDAELYIEAQFEKWAQRCNHQWTIDTAILKNYLEDYTDDKKERKNSRKV